MVTLNAASCYLLYWMELTSRIMGVLLIQLSKFTSLEEEIRRWLRKFPNYWAQTRSILRAPSYYPQSRAKGSMGSYLGMGGEVRPGEDLMVSKSRMKKEGAASSWRQRCKRKERRIHSFLHFSGYSLSP